MSNWITFNTTGGTGNTTITITAASSTDLFKKIQTLRAETTHQHKTADVILEQKRYYIGDYIVPDPDYVVIDTSGGTETIEVDASVDWAVCSIYDEKHNCIPPEPSITVHYNLDMLLYVTSANTQKQIATIYSSITSSEITGLNRTTLVAYPINIDEEGWIYPNEANYPRSTSGQRDKIIPQFSTTGMHSVQFDLSKPYVNVSGWTAISDSAVSKTYIGISVIDSAYTAGGYGAYEIFIPNICSFKPGSTFCKFENMTIDDGFKTVLNWSSRRTEEGYLPISGRTSLLRYMHVGEGVTSIDETLMGNSELVTLYLPSTLQEISNRAFLNTSNLANIYSLGITGIPDSVSVINSGSFNGSSYAGVNGVLNFPTDYKNVENIGPLTSVTSVNLSPYTKTIAGNSFSGWTSLTDIYIPCMFKPTIDSNMTGLNQTGTVHYPVYSIDVYEEIKNNFPSGWEIIMDITDNWVWQIGL